MFLSSLDRIRKTVSFRLAVWYSALFVVSSLALFGLAYYLLSASLQRIDREEIQADLDDYATVYQSDGREALTKEVEEDQAEGDDPFVARLADPQENTVILSLPNHWEETFNVTLLENDESKPASGAVHHSSLIIPRSEVEVEIASRRLPDGWLLQVGKSIEERKNVLEQFRNIFTVILLPVILIGVAGGVFLAFRALRPVRQLIAVLHSILKTGETKARVPVRHTGDELDELGDLFNTTLARIESLIEGMRAALDNVAHDLRSPMTRLRGTAEVALSSQHDSEAYREALADCLEESDHVLTMLNLLMDISEAETGAMQLDVELLNVRSLIEDVMDVYQYVAEEKDILIRTDAPEELVVVADRGRLRQALANLLDNAVKYTPPGGTIDIEASQQPQQVTITVSDTGIGIPDEDLSKIWDRLYRGDKSRSQRGLGLGLSLVRAIVHAHQGRVEVISRLNRGSQFILHLPVVSGQWSVVSGQPEKVPLADH